MKTALELRSELEANKLELPCSEEDFNLFKKRELEILHEALTDAYEEGKASGNTRDYFAAHALTGMLANPKIDASEIAALPNIIAQTCFLVADAMIDARKRKEK